MALIKCPECGAEVSDKAKNCSKCSFPIESLRTDGEIRIKMNDKNIQSRIAGKLKYVIKNAETGNELWIGFDTDIARFYLDKPTEIEIEAKGLSYRIHGKIKVNPKTSLTYQLVGNLKNPILQTLLRGILPVKFEAGLSEIDSITSF